MEASRVRPSYRFELWHRIVSAIRETRSSYTGRSVLRKNSIFNGFIETCTVVLNGEGGASKGIFYFDISFDDFFLGWVNCTFSRCSILLRYLSFTRNITPNSLSDWNYTRTLHCRCTNCLISLFKRSLPTKPEYTRTFTKISEVNRSYPKISKYARTFPKISEVNQKHPKVFEVYQTNLKIRDRDKNFTEIHAKKSGSTW